MYGDDWDQMDFNGQELAIFGVWDEETEEMIYDHEEVMEHELDSWDISEIKEWFEKEGFKIKEN